MITREQALAVQQTLLLEMALKGIGIGLTKIGEEWAVNLNVPKGIPPETLLKEKDGVRIVIEPTGSSRIL